MSQGRRFRKYPQGRWWLWLMIIGAIGFFALMKLTDYTSAIKTLRYSDFLTSVERDEVAFVKIDQHQLSGCLKDNKGCFEVVVPAPFTEWDLLKKHGVTYSIAYPIGVYWYLLLFLMLLALPLLAWMLFRQSRGGGYLGGGGGAGQLGLGKSRARMYLPSQIKVRFSSVAGAQEAKEDLADVVDFLRNPEKYTRLGAKLPKGVLLVGAPGNGKTLLAKAVAGEADCRFFAVSGSDFIEVFVGVGAARVRDLFEQARKNAPSIIFIDEIDAVGRQRGTGLGGGNDEREQTLNQLLTEMDGFAESGEQRAVVVIAATNRPDVLDKALLRPGRFDRRVDVPYPDMKSREQILQVHMRDVHIDAHVDAQKLARGTPGFTGADLESLVNEAAIIAAKAGQDNVTVENFEEARDRVLIGKRSATIVMTPRERELTAYHEAGHALINVLLPEVTDPLHKVTIIPRGPALGVTHSLPERDKYSRSKAEMLADITILLGGRVAEQLVFQEVCTGAASDFSKASAIARAMVCRYGMSEKLGTVEYDAHAPEFTYSSQTAALIDTEVRAIVDGCYAQAVSMITTERERLDTLARALLDRETLSGAEVYELLGIPVRGQHSLQ